jgi:hypothetical protein
MIKRGLDACHKFFAADHHVRNIHLFVGGPIFTAARDTLIVLIGRVFGLEGDEISDHLACASDVNDDACEFAWVPTPAKNGLKGEQLNNLIAHMVHSGIEFNLLVNQWHDSFLIAFRRDFGVFEWLSTPMESPILYVGELYPILDDPSLTAHEIRRMVRALCPPDLPALKPTTREETPDAPNVGH